MYKGLPIVTNKIPETERNGVEHHLIDHIGLEEKPWTVHEFVVESSKIIADIRSRGKLPIVVGGTNYYVFGLLFPHSKLSKEEDAHSETINGDDNTELATLNASNEEIYAKLQKVDPEMAQQWHPSDRRKIQRSLEIWLRTGRKASDLYAEQKAAKSNAADNNGHTNRAHDPLIFWMEAEDTVLKQRLDDRVKVMVRNGMLEEVQAMRLFELTSKQKGIEIDKTKGIWVAIGYKELEHWLDEQQDKATNSEVLEKLKKEGIEAIQAGTRQYAKRQNRWIRIRLANALEDHDMLDRLFLLDCTHLEKWDAAVASLSEHLVEDFTAGRPLPANTSFSPLASRVFERIRSHETEDRRVHFCESCQKTLMTGAEWKKHLNSGGHKKVFDGIRKRAAREEYWQRLSKEPS